MPALARRGHAACSVAQPGLPPMRWNVMVYDPPGSRFTHFLFDFARWVAFGLEDLGHDCSITRNRLEPGRVNVLVGVHVMTEPRLAEEIIDSGIDTVVLQTEIIHQDGQINGIPDRRYDRVLLPLLRNARGVWDSSTDNVATLAGFGIDADILIFGHCPRLEEIRPKNDRDIDFAWFGSITERRRQVLAKLELLGYRVRALFDDAALFRNDLISRAEIVPTIRQSEVLAHVPHGRILYLVHNRVLVAGEGGVEQKPVEDLYVWSGSPGSSVDDTVELLRQTRARRDRRELADAFHERLRARPMSGYLAPLVGKVAEKVVHDVRRVPR